MMDILLELETGDKSFSEFKANLSPNTLAQRLREAQKEDLVKQIILPRKNQRSVIKYTLTKKGINTLRSYSPLKKSYLNLRAELETLEKNMRNKKQRMKLLLSSLKKKPTSE